MQGRFNCGYNSGSSRLSLVSSRDDIGVDKVGNGFMGPCPLEGSSSQFLKTLEHPLLLPIATWQTSSGPSLADHGGAKSSIRYGKLKMQRQKAGGRSICCCTTLRGTSGPNREAYWMIPGCSRCFSMHTLGICSSVVPIRLGKVKRDLCRFPSVQEQSSGFFPPWQSDIIEAVCAQLRGQESSERIKEGVHHRAFLWGWGEHLESGSRPGFR